MSSNLSLLNPSLSFEDLQDLCLTKMILEKIQKGEMRVYSLEETKKKLGLEE